MQLRNSHFAASSWIGQHIGNYRLVRLLGEGGMGMVFEAAHDGVGGSAAIKILRPEVSLQPDIAARFFNEARAANAIQHPGIVRIFDSGYAPSGAAFLIMEFLRGESLRVRLDQTPKFSVANAVRIARQLASALTAAHFKNIVHRDLKPDNIMLVADPDLPGGERVKILDFGIAKIAEGLGASAMSTESDLIMGTPAYMSPEQCKSAKLVTNRSDVYALGILLYQMSAGQRPFAADSPGELMIMQVMAAAPPLRSLVPDLAAPVATLIHSMLAKDPAQRPAMDVVLSELQQIEKSTLSGFAATVAPDRGQTQKLSILQLQAERVSHPESVPLDPAAVRSKESVPTANPSTVTNAASESRFALFSQRSYRGRIVLAITLGLSLGGVMLGARHLSSSGTLVAANRPSQSSALSVMNPRKDEKESAAGANKQPTTPAISVVGTLPPPGPPTLAEPTPTPTPIASPLPAASSLPAAPPVVATPPQPTSSANPVKLVDHHYSTARKLFDTKRYADAIKEAEKCSRDNLFLCSVVRAKAACHTPSRNIVQQELDLLKESKRADRDKSIQEIRGECEADSLDYAEKLLVDKQYQRALSVARGNGTIRQKRAWELIGRAACGNKDGPAATRALSQLQDAPAQAEKVRTFCKECGVSVP